MTSEYLIIKKKTTEMFYHRAWTRNTTKLGDALQSHRCKNSKRRILKEGHYRDYNRTTKTWRENWKQRNSNSCLWRLTLPDSPFWTSKVTYITTQCHSLFFSHSPLSTAKLKTLRFPISLSLSPLPHAPLTLTFPTRQWRFQQCISRFLFVSSWQCRLLQASSISFSPHRFEPLREKLGALFFVS